MRDRDKTKDQLIEELAALRKSATAAQPAADQRQHLEQQLRQAQKVASIGQLAGGIAHDFNNQLGIILFDLDLIIANLEGNNELLQDLDKIRRVVLRSTELTRRLLLFSRRQHLEFRPVNLNQQVREMEQMLGRLLGKGICIHLELAGDLRSIWADPNTLDHLLVNLALNARDAMPKGGTLRLETRNIPPGSLPALAQRSAHQGPFSCLVVRDDGVGMEPAVKEQVFEPFFTTKDQGTGLGLAMVNGIAQAHQGWVEVESNPGKGSCFEIYLPALEHSASPPPGSHTHSRRKLG